MRREGGIVKPCKGKRDTCPNLVEYNETYCASCMPHEAERNKAKSREYEQDRGTSYERGYDAVWRKLRRYKLRLNPLCECPDCLSGKTVVRNATMVHHIYPVATHPELRLKMSNLLSMSRECHERHHGRKR